MADDTLLEADAVVVAVGVSPNIDIFRNNGISMNRFLNVNERMETSTKDIYAAGDIACVNGKWSGQWSAANRQGQVAGANAAGGNAVYETADISYILATMGTRVVCSGDTGIIRQDGSDAEYKTERRVDRINSTILNLYSVTVYLRDLFLLANLQNHSINSRR